MSAILIDDERPAREELTHLLSKHSDIEIIGVCKNALEAKELIEKLKPDVIFLDINMPKMNGFELLEKLAFIPHVIFVTAYDSYAIKAIEENALDYLLKPVLPDRLEKSLNRLRKTLNTSVRPNASSSRNVFIRDGSTYHIINLSDVFLIESYGNYIKLYYNEKVVVQQSVLKDAFGSLDQTQFLQINRSQVVNLRYIKSLSPLKNRQLKILLSNEKLLICSNRKSKVLKAALEKNVLG